MKTTNRFPVLLLLFISQLIMASCKSKKDDPVVPPTLVLTENLLTNTTANTVRLWDVLEVKRQYYSASGSIDSTVKCALPARQIIRFSIGTSGQKVYGVDYNTPLGICNIIQPVFYFTLSSDGKQLGFTPNASSSLGGTFNIDFYDVSTVSLVYKYGIDASYTRPLPGGRKVLDVFSLGGSY